MFKKILIANRGEIACRVIKTARKMGIQSVAIHADDDRDAPHVALADEALSMGLGPAAHREAYLTIDGIIAACRKAGVQAVHPGYGFLSENPVFARRVEEAGIVFIGPKHEAMAALGDKIASKQLAMQAQVHTIPGHNAAIESARQAVQIANDIGYPVMIKASAGGGGKGLRVAYDDRQTEEGYTRCQSEARSSFGDDRVFIEKFIEAPRHVEVQVLGDAHGHVVYLNERECSIQRRHQKLIEEAPSPFISDATRKAMGEQAVALAKAVHYQSAGTVEFVVGPDQRFYFLEMNTRLQVEHPVTECITGLDLVELMIRVAAGEPLPFTQAQVPRWGWAMECRINAEDAARDFLPSAGRLVKFQPPAETLPPPGGCPEAHKATGPASLSGSVVTGGVRVDTGVVEGSEISMHYDPLIAKLIVHGRDRPDAMARMREALNAFVVRGVQSNILFHAAVLAHPDFMAGRFDTGFIARHFPRGFDAEQVHHESPMLLRVLAAATHRMHLRRAVGISGQLPGHQATVAERFVVITDQGADQAEHLPVQMHLDGDAVVVTADKQTYRVAFYSPLRDLVLHARINSQPVCAQVERVGLAYRVRHNGAQIEAKVLSPRAAELSRLMPFKAPPDSSKLLRSPMPGLLTELAVHVGQAVRAGEKLAVIEAMKMENILLTTQDGVVAELAARQGDSLAVDQVILRFA